MRASGGILTDFHLASESIEACWRFLLLGVIQGLTEFLPISSTAHLKVLPEMMGWGDPGVSVTAVIQLGSILAVISYFRKDLKEIWQGTVFAVRHETCHPNNARLFIAICLGSIPIILAGTFIKLFWSGFEASPLRSIPCIGFVSILMGLLLAFAEKVGRRFKTLPLVSGKDGLIVGIGQVLALIPGVSRSGITLTTSLFNGWERQDAARFSFLLGIPAISIAGLVELRDASLTSSNDAGIIPLLVGICSSAIVSWLSIDWLLKYLQRHNTLIFVAYRLIFGVVLLAWWWHNPSN